MPIQSITTDPDALTLTAIGEFPVPVDRLWNAWTDPRTLERFWGPPTWPATFTRHEVRPGGRSEYHMTGPNGEVSKGYWVFDEVEPGERFLLHDGFATDDDQPNDELPGSRMEVVFESTPSGSRFVATSTFASLEAMEQLVAMGMVQGLTAALAQMDDVLADLANTLASTALEILDDTRVRTSRVVRGTIHQVWRAHHEPELMVRWLTGPPGWVMVTCEVATSVGASYRYEWETEAGEDRFGFVGELLEQEAPRSELTSERMIGMDGPGTTNHLVLVPQPGGRTRIDTIITYPSQELRDMVLGTGMVDGMEASYARLDELLA